VRPLAILAAALLSGCVTAPAPEFSQRDATKEEWYARTVEQVAAINREAESAFEGGQSDQAAALIQKAQPLLGRLLSVQRPTLAAMEAASDLDHLYGRMLLANRHYGWARFVFQKNLARWKHWQPQTAETARRLKQAESAIAECDRHLVD
jgi:hypothetical protein